MNEKKTLTTAGCDGSGCQCIDTKYFHACSHLFHIFIGRLEIVRYKFGIYSVGGRATTGNLYRLFAIIQFTQTVGGLFTYGHQPKMTNNKIIEIKYAGKSVCEVNVTIQSVIHTSHFIFSFTITTTVLYCPKGGIPSK